MGGEEKALLCSLSPLSLILYGLEELQWDRGSGLCSPRVTSQVTWGNCLSSSGFSFFICKKGPLYKNLKVLWGQDGELVTVETLILLLNPVQVLGCSGVGEVLDFYSLVSSLWKWRSWIPRYLSFYLINVVSSLSSSLPNSTRWVFFFFLIENFKDVHERFHHPRTCAWDETCPLGSLGHKRQSLE